MSGGSSVNEIKPKTMPIMQIIHSNNHTQTARVCNINEKHLSQENVIIQLTMNENGIFNNLKPGIYSIIIDEIEYFFDLYISILGSKESLIIKSPNNAYVKIGTKKFLINLYTQAGTNTSNELTLEDTVNNYIEMIIIDGKTIQTQINDTSIQERIAVIPNSGVLPSSTVQESERKSITELEEEDNTIIYGLDYEKSGNTQEGSPESQGTYSDEYIDNKSIDDPYLLQSISKFTIITSDQPLSESDGNELEILLKNNIKALPNGVKDTFILNSEQCQNHIIYRIGKLILSGNEDWEFISTSNGLWLFWLPYKFIKLEDSNTNIICSHLNNEKASMLIDEDCSKSGIGSGYGDYGNGFFVRIPAMKCEDTERPTARFKRWLSNELRKGSPFVVEYALQNYIYNTVLIDEYHIKTYFSRTYVKLNNTYDVSYFYKILRQR